jgi:carbonic anhydrase
MDSRLTVEELLDIRAGEAHIIRNAGGLATDDAIRSLVISQRLLGTRDVVIIQHTQCGMLTFRDEEARAQLTRETGVAVDLSFLPFDDLEANLRAQIERVSAHPWTLNGPVRGMIYELETGRLRTVA